MASLRGVAMTARGSHTARAMATPAQSDEPDDDAALMLAYAGGEAGAFDRLYHRHKGGVYRYLLRQCRSPAIADELFQDVWMNVIRVRASYRPTARFTTWLYTLAHNRLVDHWRASGRVTLVSADDDDGPARDAIEAIAGARADEPEVATQSRALGASLCAALARLPAVQRDAFLLHQEGGLPLADIAVMTGVGIETVKSRLRYALAKLRTDLADWHAEPS